MKELNDYEMLRKLASDEVDPVGEMAQEVVEQLEREVCGRETPWHDIELMTVVEEILNRRGVRASLDMLRKCEEMFRNFAAFNPGSCLTYGTAECTACETAEEIAAILAKARGSAAQI